MSWSKTNILRRFSKESPLSIQKNKFELLTLSEKLFSDEQFSPSLKTTYANKEDIFAAETNFIEEIEKTIDAANKIIEEVEEKSAGIKNEALELGEKVRQEAFEDGFSKGLLEGKKHTADTTQEKEKKLLQTIKLFESIRENIIDMSQDQVIDLIFLLVKKVIHKEVSIDKAIIINNLDKALSMILKSNEITILLNPDDISYIKSKKTDLETNFNNKNIQLVPDSKILPGGCLVKTESGSIDATIEGQLEELKSEIKMK